MSDDEETDDKFEEQRQRPSAHHRAEEPAEGKDASDDAADDKDAKRVPGKARRTRVRQEDNARLEDPSPADAMDSTGPIKPGRRARRGADKDAGGWMSSENDTKSKLSLDKNDEDTLEFVVSSNRNKHNDDDELILIPDLDEDGLDEDKRVAHAPKNVTRKIPTLTELNNEVKTVISSNDLGYDFGVLLNALVPLEFLSEPDVQWTFDNLLQEITEEFQKNSKLSAVDEPIVGN